MKSIFVIVAIIVLTTAGYVGVDDVSGDFTTIGINTPIGKLKIGWEKTKVEDTENYVILEESNLTGGSVARVVPVNDYEEFVAVGKEWISGDKGKVAVYYNGECYCKYYDGTKAKNFGAHHPLCTTMFYAKVLH